MVDEIRRFLALVLLITLPPAFLFWLIVHPFIGFWRRVGPLGTYLLNLVPAAAVGMAAYQFREPLLRVEFGFDPWLTAVGLVMYVAAGTIEVLCRRHLKFSILVGLPELKVNEPRGVLLSQGIYGRIRHPRYVGVLLGIVAFALFINYLSVYVLALLMVPAIWIVVVFEERELLNRFGESYVRYRTEVPRFIPSFRAADRPS